MREVTDLAERAGHVCLATRDEDTRCDDGVEWFPAEQLLLVCTLVELLGDVADRLG
jgi:hypothetical protein